MLQLQDGLGWREKLPEMPNLPVPPTPPFTVATQKSHSDAKAQGQVKDKVSKVTKPKVKPTVSAKVQAEFDKLKTIGNNLVKKVRVYFTLFHLVHLLFSSSVSYQRYNEMDSVDLNVNLTFLTLQKEFKVAVDCYTRCIATCPHEVAPYTNRALCYLKLEQVRCGSSPQICRQIAITLNIGSWLQGGRSTQWTRIWNGPNVHLDIQLVSLHELLLQPEKVLADCEAALELDPQNTKALFRKAQAYKVRAYSPVK